MIELTQANLAKLVNERDENQDSGRISKNVLEKARTIKDKDFLNF